MATNITIARLNTLVTANAVQFTTEFNRAENVAKRTAMSVKNVLGSLGLGLSVAGVGLFAKSVIDLGSHIVDLSTQAGMSAQSFQVLSNTAAESGVSMEMVAKAAESMRSKIQEAADGSVTAMKSLHALNLTAAGLQALEPERQWEIIAKRLATATDKQAALNAVSDLFGGKIGPKLKEVLDRLAKDGYDKLSASMAKLGLTDAQLKTLDDAGDRLTRIATQLKVIAAQKFLSILDSSPGSTTATFGDSIERILTGKVPAGLRMKSQAEIDFPHGDRTITGIKSLGPEKTIEQQMKEAADKSPFDSIRQDNAKRKAVDSLLDEFFDSLDDRAKTLTAHVLAVKIPEINTDRLSRIGLLTGDHAQDEAHKQTGYLQDIANEAKRTNAILSRGTTSTATFG